MSDAVRHPLFARFYAWLAPLEDRAGVAEHRRDLVAGLRGTVLEVDVGTGLSFPHYPADVEHLVAVEPEPTMRANAVKAAREVPLDVRLVDGTADALPAPDASVDAAVVSTGPLFRARPGARFGRAAPVAASCASTSTCSRPASRAGASSARSTRRSGPA